MDRIGWLRSMFPATPHGVFTALVVAAALVACTTKGTNTPNNNGTGSGVSADPHGSGSVPEPEGSAPEVPPAP